MSLKSIYRSFIDRISSLSYRIDWTKTFIAEWYAIIRKRSIYKDVKWSRKQKRDFNAFWIKNYGKKIPSWWHKLYQKCSGEFCVDYMPELIYSTKIEPMLCDYKYSKALEDKFLVEILSMNSGCVVPETVVACSNGSYYDSDRRVISKKKAMQIVLNTTDMIAKPTVGSSSGHGIIVIKEPDPKVVKSVFSSFGNDFIIQKLIVPHESFAKYNPSSINTIRITTYILNGKIYHFPLCFRIGRSGKSVDNIHSGGIGIGVRDDGSLLEYAYDLGYGDCIKKMKEHPDSGVVFDGNVLPSVKRILDSAYRMQGRFPHIKIISWDFTVNNKGEAVLIEANIKGQAVWFPQMIFGKAVFGEHTKEILKLIR